MWREQAGGWICGSRSHRQDWYWKHKPGKSKLVFVTMAMSEITQVDECEHRKEQTYYGDPGASGNQVCRAKKGLKGQ